MTKEEFDKRCADLEQRGYKRSFRKGETPRANGWDHYYKNIERGFDKHGGSRNICTLLFNIWRFDEYGDRVPLEAMYSLEPVIMFSRSTDERLDLTLSHPERSVDELEELAVKFCNWCKENVKEL